MEPIVTNSPLRRRRRALPGAASLTGAPIGAFHPATPPARMTPTPTANFGYVEQELPPGSRRVGPVHDVDQGVSNAERPHAERAISRLFEAGGVDMIALYDRETGLYELRSRTGIVRWERWATPDGQMRYKVVYQAGENPIPNDDGTILRTFEEETAAAGGVGKPVPKKKNSYPDMLGRIAQLWDDPRAPEFVYIPKPGGDPNHPGAGSHGIPDMVQSRAPLVIAGPGIARGAVTDLMARHEDLSATLADLVGVQPIEGTNASGVRRTQLLKWQDGHSLAGSLVDAAKGAAHGIAQRALVFTIDGLSQTALLDEIGKGHLPNMARIMARGTMFRNGTLAEYPTVTYANHHTLLTGAAPGHSGIVNNSWWNRESQTEQLITDGGFKNALRNGKLVRPDVETIYEAVERSFPDVRTMAINQPAGRGADIDILNLKGFPALLGSLPRILLSVFHETKQVAKDLMSDKEWKSSTIQDAFATGIGQAMYAKDKLPKLGVFEYTIVDNQGHHKGPHHPDARTALQQVDSQLGKVLDTLEQRGAMDSTAIVLTADHGMEHQSKKKSQLGGWFQALDRAAADGARTKESTRFVYVRSVRWGVDGAVPATGTTGPLTISVVNDDADASGKQPPIAGATVTVRDASGGSWQTVTDAQGRAQLQVSPTAGQLDVTVEHVDFSVEHGAIQVPGGAAAAPKRRRSGAH
jgi:hypothetical protein